MTLQERLDAMREASRTRIPEDAGAVMQRSIDELRAPLSCELLRDFGNHAAEAYGLVFRLPAGLRGVYLKLGIDLARGNGDGTWRLPVPARFVIDRQGVIRAVDADPDYTRRPEPARTVAVLAGLREAPRGTPR